MKRISLSVMVVFFALSGTVNAQGWGIRGIFTNTHAEHQHGAASVLAPGSQGGAVMQGQTMNYATPATQYQQASPPVMQTSGGCNSCTNNTNWSTGCCDSQPSCCSNIWDNYCSQRQPMCYQPMQRRCGGFGGCGLFGSSGCSVPCAPRGWATCSFFDCGGGGCCGDSGCGGCSASCDMGCASSCGTGCGLGLHGLFSGLHSCCNEFAAGCHNFKSRLHCGIQGAGRRCGKLGGNFFSCGSSCCGSNWTSCDSGCDSCATGGSCGMSYSDGAAYDSGCTSGGCAGSMNNSYGTPVPATPHSDHNYPAQSAPLYQSAPQQNYNSAPVIEAEPIPTKETNSPALRPWDKTAKVHRPYGSVFQPISF